MVVSRQGVAGLLPSSMPDLLIGLAWGDHPERRLSAAARAVAETLTVICCAPVICAALIGEVAGLRNVIWYVGATATLSLILPLAAMHAGNPAGIADAVAYGPLGVTGALAGAAYWLVAGGGTSDRTGDAIRFDLAAERKSVSDTQDA